MLSLCVCVPVCVDASLCMPARPAHVAFMLTDCVSSCKPSICHSIHLHIFTLPRLATSRLISSRLVSSRLTSTSICRFKSFLAVAHRSAAACCHFAHHFFGLVSLKQPLTASERIEQPSSPSTGSCLDGVSIWMWIHLHAVPEHSMNLDQQLSATTV